MAMDLNLLPSRAKFQEVKIKLQKKINLIMMVIIGLWIGVGALILAMNVIMGLKIKTANNQLKQAKEVYIGMSNNIITSQRLKYKAKIVGELLDKRFEYSKAFEAINSLFPSGVIMTDFQLKEQGGFKLSATTSGKENMDKIEKMISEINLGKHESFSSAEIRGLKYINGNWDFSMEVALK